MAKDIGGRRRLVLVGLLLSLVALPASLAESRDFGASPRSEVPPSLDAFLAAVRDATPPAARLLVVGEPPVLVFERPVYALYPRVVYSAVDTSYMRAHRAQTFSWPGLGRLARRDRARYILVWAPRSEPRGPLPGPVLLRQGAGRLVGVAP